MVHLDKLVMKAYLTPLTFQLNNLCHECLQESVLEGCSWPSRAWSSIWQIHIDEHESSMVCQHNPAHMFTVSLQPFMALQNIIRMIAL